MPREMIYSSQTPRTPGGPTPDLTYVQVTWQRDDRAQVCVHPVIEQGEDRPPALTVDLDRRRINALIRVLRRARDQAYGRDE